MTPTARSLAELRRLGYLAEVVERWVPQAKIRKDLFGFIDILAVPDVKIGFPGHMLAVQATSGSNHADRCAKIRAHPNLEPVLAAGIRVEVWSWAKQGPRGKRKTWTLRRERISRTATTSEIKTVFNQIEFAAPVAVSSPDHPADKGPQESPRRPGRLRA